MHQAAHDSAEFLDALATIQIDAVKTLLENMTHPLWECDLLRAAFPDAETAGCQALILYRQHFLLFHSLYRLADEYLTQGRYLHIHFMRTSLSCLPQAGQCRHYHEETGCFCLAATDNDFSLCKFHRGKVPSEAIDQLSDRYFYLDWHNYFSLNSETAEKFVNGTWELLINHQDYLDCLKILIFRKMPRLLM
jgi:hypothetical protein